MRRRRRRRRGVVLDLLFVLLPIVLLLVFFEPITQWVGQYMADAIMRSITHASPSSSP